MNPLLQRTDLERQSLTVSGLSSSPHKINISWVEVVHTPDVRMKQTSISIPAILSISHAQAAIPESLDSWR